MFKINARVRMSDDIQLADFTPELHSEINALLDSREIGVIESVEVRDDGMAYFEINFSGVRWYLLARETEAV